MEAVDDFQDLSDESSALRINASWENDIHGYRLSEDVRLKWFFEHFGVIRRAGKCLKSDSSVHKRTLEYINVPGSQLTKVWSSTPLPTKCSLSVFIPSAPPGFSTLCHVAERSLDETTFLSTVAVRDVCATCRTDNLTCDHCPTADSYVPLLAPPMDYEKLWDSQGLSCEYISFWRPIPQEGYSCAGYVAWTQRGPPPQRLIMCLHDSCTEPALCNPGDRHPLWCDAGIHSKFGDISLWPLFDATTCGFRINAFAVNTQHDSPPNANRSNKAFVTLCETRSVAHTSAFPLLPFNDCQFKGTTRIVLLGSRDSGSSDIFDRFQSALRGDTKGQFRVDGCPGIVIPLVVGNRWLALHFILAVDNESCGMTNSRVFYWADVAVMCYNVKDQETLGGLSMRWDIELKQSARPSLCRILAGTRTIGRSGECASGEKSGVSTGDAVQLASSLKARLIEMETNQNEETGLPVSYKILIKWALEDRYQTASHHRSASEVSKTCIIH